jgi:hypothetical protein
MASFGDTAGVSAAEGRTTGSMSGGSGRSEGVGLEAPPDAVVPAERGRAIP